MIFTIILDGLRSQKRVRHLCDACVAVEDELSGSFVLTHFELFVDIEDCGVRIVICEIATPRFVADILRDAAIREIVGVLGTHLIVFDSHQPAFEIPGTGQTVNVEHVAIFVVAVRAVGYWGLQIGNLREGVGAGRISGGTAITIEPTCGSAGGHGAKVGDRQAA